MPLPLEGAAPAAPLLLCPGGRRSCGAAFALPWRASLLRRLSASIESPAIFAGVDDVPLTDRPRSPAPARSRAAAQSAALHWRHRRMAVERGLPVSFAVGGRRSCGAALALPWRASLLRRRFCFALEGAAPAAPVGLNRIAGNIRGCRRCVSRQSTPIPRTSQIQSGRAERGPPLATPPDGRGAGLAPLPLPLEGAAPAAPLLLCPGGRRSCGACRPQSNRRQYSRVSTMYLSPIDPIPRTSQIQSGRAERGPPLATPPDGRGAGLALLRWPFCRASL